jgi:hypothetical protein
MTIISSHTHTTHRTQTLASLDKGRCALELVSTMLEVVCVCVCVCVCVW